MYRISKERQESNIRVSTLEASISRALATNTPEELTHLEILEALGRVQARWLQVARNNETASVSKE